MAKDEELRKLEQEILFKTTRIEKRIRVVEVVTPVIQKIAESIDKTELKLKKVEKKTNIPKEASRNILRARAFSLGILK